MSTPLTGSSVTYSSSTPSKGTLSVTLNSTNALQGPATCSGDLNVTGVLSGPTITALQAAIRDAGSSAQLASLGTQVAAQGVSITTLQTQVAEHETDIAGILTKNEQQDTSIASLAQSVSALQTEDTAINSRATALSSTVTGIGNRTTQLESTGVLNVGAFLRSLSIANNLVSSTLSLAANGVRAASLSLPMDGTGVFMETDNAKNLNVRCNTYQYRLDSNGTIFSRAIQADIANLNRYQFQGRSAVIMANLVSSNGVATTSCDITVGSNVFSMNSLGRMSAGSLLANSATVGGIDIRPVTGGLQLGSSLVIGTDGSTTVLGSLRLAGSSNPGTAPAAGALPYYPNQAAARAGGLRRWQQFRDGYLETSTKIFVLGDPQAGIRFDATPYVNMPVDLINNEWTIEGWFYFNLPQSAYLITIRRGNVRISLETNGGGRVAPQSLTVNNPVQPPTEQWFHLAMQLTANGDINIWLNGQDLYGSIRAPPNDPTASPPFWSMLGTGCIAYFGADQVEGSFFGAMSNVRISDRAIYLDAFGNPLKSFPLLLPMEASDSTKVLLQGWPPKNVVNNASPSITTTAGIISKIVMPTIYQNAPIASTIRGFDMSVCYVKADNNGGGTLWWDMDQTWTVQAWLQWPYTTAPGITDTFVWLDTTYSYNPLVGDNVFFYVNAQGFVGIRVGRLNASYTTTSRPLTNGWNHVAIAKIAGDRYVTVAVNGLFAGTLDIPANNWGPKFEIGVGATYNARTSNAGHWHSGLSQVCVSLTRTFIHTATPCNDLSWLKDSRHQTIFFLELGTGFQIPTLINGIDNLPLAKWGTFTVFDRPNNTDKV